MEDDASVLSVILLCGHRTFHGMSTQVRAAHILVKKEDQARELLARARDGEDFAELARRYSECPSGKAGGDLGWFGKGQMVRAFEDAAFGGNKGDTLSPVETEFGWHLIRVIDRR